MKVYKSSVDKLFSQKTTLGEFLQKLTKMPELEVAEAARKGAVWVQRGGKGKTLRIRSAKDEVHPKDFIQFFYDPRVLSLPEVKEAKCLYENENYGIWVKPQGVVSQGTQTGDHASIMRFIEMKKRKEVHLVHRLDRETEGLMVFAYNAQAAAEISFMFQKNEIKKEYEAIVLGEIEAGTKATITASLDDKEAITHYEVLYHKSNQSLLKIQIDTGRLHQIRRHLDAIHHPIMGDPKYGRGNKNKKGLMLIAKSLSFKDPFDHQLKEWHLENALSID